MPRIYLEWADMKAMAQYPGTCWLVRRDQEPGGWWYKVNATQRMSLMQATCSNILCQTRESTTCYDPVSSILLFLLKFLPVIQLESSPPWFSWNSPCIQLKIPLCAQLGFLTKRTDDSVSTQLQLGVYTLSHTTAKKMKYLNLDFGNKIRTQAYLYKFVYTLTAAHGKQTPARPV